MILGSLLSTFLQQQYLQQQCDVFLLTAIAGLVIGTVAGFMLAVLANRNQEIDPVESEILEFADLYNNALCGHHSLDQSGVFRRINDTELNWLGYTREEVIGKRKFIDLLTPSAQDLFQQNFLLGKQQGWMPDLELELLCANGYSLPILLSSTMVQQPGNHNRHAITIHSALFDLTERKQAELESLQNQDLRKAIFNESTDAIFLVDAETMLTLDCNPRAVELYQADDRQELVNIEGHTLQCRPFTPAELSEIRAEMNANGFWSRELEYRTLKGNSFWGNLSAKQIQVAGKLINLVRITDVTARRWAEEQIHIALQEKELLLREMHHRVKNNLHVIANLLDLQSEQLHNPQILELFADCQNRIQAMALVHEQLYQSQDFVKIDFGEYIYRLIGNLAFSYGNQIRSIQPTINAESVEINLETAIPCGLLLNELVTNAFKHAFPNGEPGKVKIQLYKDREQIHLKIEDDGVGISPNVDWQSPTSLGLRLVKILAQQLKAILHLNCSQGTQVHLVFSELQYRLRF